MAGRRRAASLRARTPATGMALLAAPFVVLVALVSLVALAAPAAAQGANVDAWYDAVVPLDARTMQDVSGIRSQCQVAEGEAATWFTISPDGDWFRFEETDIATACDELRWPVQVVPGAEQSTAHVQFTADRNVTRTYSTVLPRNVEHEVRTYAADGSLVTATPLYPPSAGSDHSDFAVAVDLATVHSVGWFVADVGYIINQGVGDNPVAVSSDIARANHTGLQIAFEQVPLPHPEPVARESRVEGNDTVTTIAYPVSVPQVNGSVTLHLRVAGDPVVLGLETPNGTIIPPEQFAVTTSGGRSEIVYSVPGGADGSAPPAGDYTLLVESRTPVPAIIQAAPDRFYPLAALLLLAPLPATVWTGAGVWRYSRRARDVYGRTAGMLVAAFALGVLAYGLLLVQGLRFIGFHRLATLPPSGAAAGAYGQGAVLFVGILALGVTASRVLHRSLEENIAHRVAKEEELEAALRDLRRSNDELEQFAAVASHDLREPLRKVTQNASMLQRRYGDTLDERGQRYIGTMMDATKRMQALIRDLLALSRVGQDGREPERVDLGEAVADVLTLLESAVQESGARIEYAHLPVVWGHPVEIRQLLQNLIGNAIKFRHHDQRPNITVTAQPGVQPGFHCIAVGDDGIGIAERHRDKIFQVFERLHGRDVYAGTGIGLAVCRKIVDRHGGSIRVESQEGEGSTFYLELPDGNAR